MGKNASTKLVSFSFFKVRQAANQRPSSSWAYLTKHFTNSSQNGLLICASKLQIYKCLSVKLHLQVNFTKCRSALYKCSLCLTVILTVNLEFRQ